MFDAVYLGLGLVLLYFGAEWLVAGAAGMARSYGIRPLIIGLTVVAYGTSAPELVVGIGAAASGQGAIALGNVIGSNIANLGLILGVAALVRPALVDRSLLGREMPVLLVTTAMMPLLLLDGTIAIWEAAGLLGLAIAYSAWMIATARRGSLAEATEMATDAELATGLPHAGSRTMLALRALAGLGLLVGGGHLLVEGAVGIARTVGLSERVIGLTIVAVGTSLPELATSVIAAVRGHSELAVGNVIGSNIFNVLLIGGAAGLAGAIGAPIDTLAVDLIALAAITALAAGIMATGARISRVEGGVLLAGYTAFLVVLLART